MLRRYVERGVWFLLRSGWVRFTMFGLGGLRDGDILFVMNICALTETIRFITDEINYNSL